MNVTLHPELEKRLAEEVRTGTVSDADEFLNRAIFHYILARDLGQAFDQQELDDFISEGLAEIETGETIEGEEAFRYLRNLRNG